MAAAGGVARAAGQTVGAPPSLSAAFLLAPPDCFTEDAVECSGNKRQGLVGGDELNAGDGNSPRPLRTPRCWGLTVAPPCQDGRREVEGEDG